MQAAGGLLVAAVDLVFLGGLMQFLRHAISRGDLERNSLIGIKTKITKSSDLAWKAGHEAARPGLLVAAWVGYFFGLSGIVVAFIGMATGTGGPIALVVPGAGMLGIVVILLITAAQANKAGTQAIREAGGATES